MIPYSATYEYINSEDTKLFTVSLLPNNEDCFPVVVIRTPYVDNLENEEESNIAVQYLNEYKLWLKHGYAIVIQHCRGRGKSYGDCIPYINERMDGLNLQNWIRKQNFYNGSILLFGASYLSSVHYVTAPFSDDIKGAIFGVQDSERYNICYRNGCLKRGLHAAWYVEMYKAKSHIKKNYTEDAFNLLPLKDFTKTVFGEEAEDFDQMLKAPNPSDDFWNTHLGGCDAKGATENVNFPILFTTSFYDIYTGGVFDMWNKMSKNSKALSALVVSPYDHGDGYEVSYPFEKGRRYEQFGEKYEIEWFDYVLGRRNTPPFKQGEVTYYNLFENKWKTDKFYTSESNIKLQLGDKEETYVYNPYDPPTFKGGLSCNFGGSDFQDEPNSRHDIISVYSKPFETDIFVKGKMSANLNVKSNCEDTCFYIRISITKEQGDYGLRDDITTLCYQLKDYKPGSYVDLKFNFDEHAFMIKKGEKLRIDIASADNKHYVRHTNNKGLYSEQTTAKIAVNTVDLQKSFLILPVDKI